MNIEFIINEDKNIEIKLNWNARDQNLKVSNGGLYQYLKNELGTEVNLLNGSMCSALHPNGRWTAEYSLDLVNKIKKSSFRHTVVKAKTKKVPATSRKKQSAAELIRKTNKREPKGDL